MSQTQKTTTTIKITTEETEASTPEQQALLAVDDLLYLTLAPKMDMLLAFAETVDVTRFDEAVINTENKDRGRGKDKSRYAVGLAELIRVAVGTYDKTYKTIVKWRETGIPEGE